MGKSLGTGYRDIADLAADPDLLDPPIRPLVHALNQTGWAHTIFSCAGHPEEPDSIKTGRRQAHIDLLVNNLPLWQTYIRSIPHVPNLRLTEGPLGPLPTWLAAQGFGDAAPAQGFGTAAHARGSGRSAGGSGSGAPAGGSGDGQSPAWPGEARQDSLGVQGSAASPGRRSLSWHYRRLVFEPVPYDQPAAQCRSTLDTALSAATSALQSLDPHTSRADTH